MFVGGCIGIDSTVGFGVAVGVWVDACNFGGVGVTGVVGLGVSVGVCVDAGVRVGVAGFGVGVGVTVGVGRNLFYGFLKTLIHQAC